MSKSDLNSVEHLYDTGCEHEWHRLERHRTEFGVTLRAFADFLPPPPARIIDVGGGPGRYAIALAERGYDVTLLDLSQENLALAKTKAGAAGIDLAAQEGLRLLGENGRFFAAFITRFAPFRDAAAKYPDWLVHNHTYAEQILATGVHNRGNGFVNAYFAHPAEIHPFMESMGLTTLNLIGCEGVVSAVEEKINQLAGADWALWVDFNYRVEQDPSLHGAADHLLYIGQK